MFIECFYPEKVLTQTYKHYGAVSAHSWTNLHDCSNYNLKSGNKIDL